MVQEKIKKLLANFYNLVKVVIACILLGMFIFLAMFPVANYFQDVLQKKEISLKTSIAKEILQKETSQLKIYAAEIAKSEILKKYVMSEDVLGCLSILSQESEKRGLDFASVVNQEGVTLTRTRTVSKRGDNMFYNSPLGRAAAEGKSLVSFEKSSIDENDFILIASSPILDNGKMVGTVFGGYSLNNKTAERLKGIHSEFQADTAFYLKSRGIVGQSFSNPDIASKLNNLFNAGSDWIKKGRGGDLVVIDGHELYVENIVLNGTEKSEGGVLVFIPVSYWPELGILLVIWTFILLVIAFCINRRHKYFRGKYTKVFIWMLTGSLVIGLSFTIWNNRPQKQKPIKLAQPTARIYNSVLRFEPEFGVFEKKYQQQLAVKLISGGENINAANIVINYDPAMVEVRDINTTHSFCQDDLFVEKSIDNKKGEVTIVCGVPTPGFNGDEGVVAELIVKPLKEGAVSFTFSPYTQVLANDGLGTDVLRHADNASYNITEGIDELQTYPLVISPSHPDSERWYADKNIMFYWNNPVGQKISYSFDQDKESVPDKNYQGWLSDKKFIKLQVEKDGIYYFHTLLWKAGKPVYPASYVKVKVDTTPPEAPTMKLSNINLTKGEILRMEFFSRDELSGLQKNYYVTVDNNYFLPTGSSLFMPFIESGKHTITVRAFDNAGNYSDTSQEIRVK